MASSSRAGLRTHHVTTSFVAAGVAATFVVALSKALRTVRARQQLIEKALVRPKIVRSRKSSTQETSNSTSSDARGASSNRHHVFSVVFFEDGVEKSYEGRIQLKEDIRVAEQQAAGKSADKFPLLTIPPSCKVYMVDDAATADLLLEPYLVSLSEDPTKHAFMGLDTEWTEGDKVALLQIDTGDSCFLFRVLKIIDSLPQQQQQQQSPGNRNKKKKKKKNNDNKTKDAAAHAGSSAKKGARQQLPGSLQKLLSHPRVMFSGSAIRGDVRMLHAQLGVKTANFIDLQDVCKRHPKIRDLVQERVGCSVGLQALTRCFLGRDLNKDNRIRCGDWGVDEYSHEQVHYAAVDAIVGRRVLLEMVRHAHEEDESALPGGAEAAESAADDEVEEDQGDQSDAAAVKKKKVSLSPVRVQRRFSSASAARLPLSARDMWAWCTDLLLHGKDLDKEERQRAKLRKTKQEIDESSGNSAGQRRRSWKPVLHPVLRQHDKKMKMALGSPKYTAKLLASLQLQRVADFLGLCRPLAPNNKDLPRVDAQSVVPVAQIRASSCDKGKVPTNCYPAVLHTSTSASLLDFYQVAPTATVSRKQSSSRGDKSANGANAGEEAPVGRADKWGPLHDWRASRQHCVFRAVDGAPNSARSLAVSSKSTSTVSNIPSWNFTVVKNGGSSKKKKQRPSLVLSLPGKLAELVETAFIAGIDRLRMRRSALEALLIPAASTNASDEEDQTARQVVETSTIDERLPKLLVDAIPWDPAVEGNNAAGCDDFFEVPILPNGSIPLDNSTTLMRSVDDSAAQRLCLAPCHWFEVEYPTPVRAKAYSFRATASAACRTNAPSCWVFQGHRLSTDEHQASFSAFVDKQCSQQQQQQQHGLQSNPVAESMNNHPNNDSLFDDDDGWVNLHRVEGGVSLTGNTAVDLVDQIAAVGQTGPDGDGRSTGWSYDTTYKAGEVPGELRFFDVPAPAPEVGAALRAGNGGGSNEPADAPVSTFKRFRWIFFARPLHLDRLAEAVQKRELKDSEANERLEGKSETLGGAGGAGSRAAAIGGVHSEGSADEWDLEHIERPAFSVQISRLDVYTDLVDQSGVDTP